MSLSRRRALVAATLSALLLSANAADAACVESVCVTTTAVQELVDDVVNEVGFEPTDVGGGPGQLCVYTKFQRRLDPNGLVTVTDRWVWEESWEWGEAHPEDEGYWDWRVCSLIQCADLLPQTAATCPQPLR